MYRQTWVEIDLKALEHNFKVIKKMAGSGVKILIPVKADAYGHGIIQVACSLEKMGVDYLGVGAIDEAVALRNANVKCPILFLGSVLQSEVYIACDYNISLTASSKQHLEIFNRISGEKNKKLNVHIKIDTGMSRLGIWHLDVLDVIQSISQYSHLSIEGIYTHFHSADDRERKHTLSQIEFFKDVVGKFKNSNTDFKYIHAANSMGVVNFRDSYFNMVRPGLLVYGLYPDTRCLKESNIKVEPVMSFKSRLVLIKKVVKGQAISYSRTYVAKEDRVVGVVPVGYGDGYLRALSNRSEVLISGKKAKVLGRVCMDQIIIDLNSIASANVGDEVVLIGKQGSQQILAEELSDIASTISYEIVCLISKRVPRIFVDRKKEFNIEKITTLNDHLKE